MAGAAKQTMQATNQVRQAGVLSSTLNAASQGISSTIGAVGSIADSVAKVGTQGLGSLGKMVNKMTQSVGNKPTPAESYVAMVTKQNAKGATMA